MIYTTVHFTISSDKTNSVSQKKSTPMIKTRELTTQSIRQINKIVRRGQNTIQSRKIDRNFAFILIPLFFSRTCDHWTFFISSPSRSIYNIKRQRYLSPSFNSLTYYQYKVQVADFCQLLNDSASFWCTSFVLLENLHGSPASTFVSI